jgi:hypothetical protein
MSATWEEHLVHAQAALTAGDPRAAFAALRSALHHPAQVTDNAWSPLLTTFEQVARAIAGTEFGDIVNRAARDPANVQAFFDLGYALIDQGLPGIAATVLARADQLRPGTKPVVRELAVALERARCYPEARRLLARYPQLVAQDLNLQYLAAFNALLTGDLDEARTRSSSLDAGNVLEAQQAVGQLRTLLVRADKVRPLTGLGPEDLRGWQYVMTGTLLLHLAAAEFQGMNGRYAFVQDSPTQCREGIERVAAVLQTWTISPGRVWIVGADRDSHILGIAAARILGWEAAEWPIGGADAPGLIAVYDLSRVPEPWLAPLHTRRPGQLLWSHVTCWTQEGPFAADLTTYLYQYNKSPWEAGRLRVDPATGKMADTPAATGDPHTLADEVIAATPATEDLADLPALQAFAAGVNPPSSTGLRPRQRVESRVFSSHFD